MSYSSSLLFWLLISVSALFGCSETADDFQPFPRLVMGGPPQNAERPFNREASIPPMCYTKTEEKYNPCYVCHQSYSRKSNSLRSNTLNDGELQGNYAFSEIGRTNHWHNLFSDRQEYINTITDQLIDNYVSTNNYSALSNRLKEQDWQGYIPDLTNLHLGHKAFHPNGLARDNSHWVAYNYKPFPSSFWPTNGSMGDAAIRLPRAFREINQQFNQTFYQLNLALVEMAIKDLTVIAVNPFDEQHHQIDINGDGLFENKVTQLVRPSHYFGDASSHQWISQQFPKGTELLHTVRYIGVDKTNQIVMPVRMKEVRYMRKIKVLSADELDNRYAMERKEKRDQALPHFNYHADAGMENSFGWLLSGFIEDQRGQLRPQTYQELFSCMGCHGAVGTTVDQTFSFARKLPAQAGWGYINLHGMRDTPNQGQIQGDYLTYLQRVGGGDEFRQNREMLSRWFDANGKVLKHKVENADVYTLITPSPTRARQLNKAYTLLVRNQSYNAGRSANWLPAENVHRKIDANTQPLPHQYRVKDWDLKLEATQSATQLATHQDL